MRDRLKELLEAAYNDPKVRCPRSEELTCDGCKYDLGDHCDISAIIADHLLANGVIVPPCKVGTTLFFLYNSPYADKPDLTPRIYKTTDWYFEVDKAGIVINTSYIHSFNKAYDYVLGKTVFLTREEAEKALAEREGKG